MPLLLVCEDNGLGISVPTPQGWVAAMFAGRSGLEYRDDDGRDPLAALQTAREAAQVAREHRRPVAAAPVAASGSEGMPGRTSSRPTGRAADIAADLERDPIAATMRALVAPASLDAGARCGGGGSGARDGSPGPCARRCGDPS